MSFRAIPAPAGGRALPDRRVRGSSRISTFPARPGCMSCARRMRTRRSTVSIRRRRGRCPACWVSSPAGTCAIWGLLPCTVPVASVAPMIVPPRLALANGTGAACRRSGGVRRRRNARRLRAMRRRRWAWITRVLPCVVDAPAALLRGRAAAVGPGAGQSVVSVPEGRRGSGARGDRRPRRTSSNWRWSTTVSSSRAIETRGAIGQHDADGYPPDILRRRRACDLRSSLPTACFACRMRRCGCRARMSAAASASRTRCIPNGSCCCGRPAGSADR